MLTRVEIENFYPSLQGFDEETQDLLGKFHQSKEANQLTQALIEIAIAGIDLQRIKPIIAGKYFEEIAGLYVQSQQQTKDRFILSPSETNRIYRQLYSNTHVYSLYDFYKMLHGITVPDGLIFQQSRKYLRLKGVCEYTVQNNAASSIQKQTQLTHYQQPEYIAKDLGMYEEDWMNNAPEYGKDLRKLLSHIRPDIPHLPISLTSFNSWEIIYALPAVSEEKRGQLPYLPFNSKEYNSYLSKLIYRITSKYQLKEQLSKSYTDILDALPLPTPKLSQLWSKTGIPQEYIELYRKILTLT